MMTDWSNIPGPAVNLILQRLTFNVDYVRFRSVCADWRSIAPKRPQFPWLLQCDFQKDILKRKYGFSGLSRNKIVPVNQTETISSGICCGSSHGWMAFHLTTSDTADVFLWNPITEYKIKLPMLFHPFKLLLSSDPSSDRDCVALAMLYPLYSRLVFCRLNDKSWTPIANSDQCFIDDSNISAVFYRGSFYVVSERNMYVCVLGHDPRLEKVHVDQWPCDGHSYLVESFGDLLLFVLSEIDGEVRGGAFRVNLDEKTAKLKKVKGLGDRVLFLCKNQLGSVSIKTKDGGNCVYLMDECRERIMVLRFENCRLELIACSGLNLVSWIAPNLLPLRDFYSLE